MKFTRASKPVFIVDYEEEYGDFLQKMWANILGGDNARLISYESLKDIHNNVKSIPIEDFNNDRDLKSLVCVSIVKLLDCMVDSSKESSFLLAYNCSSNTLELTMV